MKTSERTLSNLLGTGDKLYIYLANDSAKTNFMETAEKEGFSFGDGANPTERKADTIMALFDDKTICYLGFAGFMAFRHATHHSDKLIIRIDFQRYMNGETNYYYDELKAADYITVKRSTTEAPARLPESVSPKSCSAPISR